MLHIDLSDIFKRTIYTFKKHGPEILMGLGIFGMLTTTVLAVSETPEALRRIEAKKKEENHKKLTTMQTIQAAGSCYIPAIITGVASTACLIGSSSMSGKRSAALATAYSISETALKEYKSKVVETIGEKKENTIQDAVDRERIERNPPSQEVLLAEGSGKTLCYDALCGRYFYSDIETLRHSANELNRRMTTGSETYISLNEFYMEIGLSVVEIGDELGWNVGNGLIELYFSSQLAHGTTPCLVMTFQTMPEYRFSDF